MYSSDLPTLFDDPRGLRFRRRRMGHRQDHRRLLSAVPALPGNKPEHSEENDRAIERGVDPQWLNPGQESSPPGDAARDTSKADKAHEYPRPTAPLAADVPRLDYEVGDLRRNAHSREASNGAGWYPSREAPNVPGPSCHDALTDGRQRSRPLRRLAPERTPRKRKFLIHRGSPLPSRRRPTMRLDRRRPRSPRSSSRTLPPVESPSASTS